MGINDGVTSTSTPTPWPSSVASGKVLAEDKTPYTKTLEAGEGTYVANIYANNVSCPQHHGTKQTGWPTLNYASGTDIKISHKDINALKFAVNSLQENWSRSGGHDNFYATKATFNASTGAKMTLNHWESVAEVINTLNTYMSATTFVSDIDTNVKIKKTYHNEIITKFKQISEQCLCNSDCLCNSQCVCNTDCGCHYSDIRLKKDITYLYTRKLDGKYIQIYEYVYKDNTELNLESGKQVGVIAQELIDLELTEYVVETESGFYSVRYNILKDLLDF